MALLMLPRGWCTDGDRLFLFLSFGYDAEGCFPVLGEVEKMEMTEGGEEVVLAVSCPWLM